MHNKTTGILFSTNNCLFISRIAIILSPCFCVKNWSGSHEQTSISTEQISMISRMTTKGFILWYDIYGRLYFLNLKWWKYLTHFSVGQSSAQVRKLPRKRRHDARVNSWLSNFARELVKLLHSLLSCTLINSIRQCWKYNLIKTITRISFCLSKRKHDRWWI